jgi:hypothetical protein
VTGTVALFGFAFCKLNKLNVLETVDYDLFNQQKWNSSDTEEIPTEKTL